MIHSASATLCTRVLDLPCTVFDVHHLSDPKKTVPQLGPGPAKISTSLVLLEKQIGLGLFTSPVFSIRPPCIRVDVSSVYEEESPSYSEQNVSLRGYGVGIRRFRMVRRTESLRILPLVWFSWWKLELEPRGTIWALTLLYVPLPGYRYRVRGFLSQAPTSVTFWHDLLESGARFT